MAASAEPTAESRFTPTRFGATAARIDSISMLPRLVPFRIKVSRTAPVKLASDLRGRPGATPTSDHQKYEGRHYEPQYVSQRGQHQGHHVARHRLLRESPG